MSLEIFLQCYRNGDRATFKRALAEEIFARHAINYSPPLLRVDYADGSGGEIYGADNGEDIPGLMCTHCGGATFYDALYELAHRTRSVIFWPSGKPMCAITEGTAIGDINPGFREEPLGPPIVVKSGRELALGIQQCLLAENS